MAQPVWETPSGSLGTIPEGIFYSTSVRASAGEETVYFRLIAGSLPEGVQVRSNGQIEGSPRNVVRVQGVPREVSEDVTSQFVIRAYTTKVVDGLIVVDRLSDRTFSITVTGQDAPEFLTPSGRIGTFFDGTEVKIQLRWADTDLDDEVRLTVVAGELPQGLTLDPKTGLISGIILPLVGPTGTAEAGYDRTPYDQFPYSFSSRSASKNYQFTVKLDDGKENTVRNFGIFVYSKSSMTADNADVTADNTWITADVTPVRRPLLLTPPGDLGRVRADNFYAFKFDGIDFDGDPIEYSVTVGPGVGFDSGTINGSPGSFDNEGFDRGSFSLPPGLVINTQTGWFYGYIPDQGATEQTYKFAVRVAKANDPTVISGYYYFTITITGEFATEVFWITDPDLGTIPNGSISTLAVEAVNPGGRSLQYRLAQGSNSRLPEGLTLQSSGHITGRVSFNTFALDGGATTFDTNLNTRLNIIETTFDSKYEFTVNAFSAESEQVGYQVGSIIVTNGGSGYTSQPTVTISAPPATVNSIQATTGPVTIENGVITAISIGNPGRGYTSPPTITITGGGGSNASAVINIVEADLQNAVSVFRRFTVTVDRVFNEPYEKLYIKCMPPQEDRDLISTLTQNQDLIPESLVYRPDDANFGVAKSVIYDHAYGLTAASLDDYVDSLDLNHYWKYLTLGEIKTAQALDSNGNVLYEVIYSEVVDNLVNDRGQSVGKSVELTYPVTVDNVQTEQVYPNSLINMRDQVIDTVGQISPALPLWMTSKQPNGVVLGFTPAWVIAYLKPGQANRVLYNINQKFGQQLNRIDFKVDRYELDRSQTWQWDNATDLWQPQPPAATTFDTFSTSPQLVSWISDNTLPAIWENDNGQAVFWTTPPSGIPQSGTIFDGGSTRFITPTVRWVNTDEFDKYLVFPKINILE